MTKTEYDQKVKELAEVYRKGIDDLQAEFERTYDTYKVGDVVRSKEGFRTYMKVVNVRFVRDRSRIIVMLDCRTVNNKGKEYPQSFTRSVKDDTVNFKMANEQ